MWAVLNPSFLETAVLNASPPRHSCGPRAPRSGRKGKGRAERRGVGPLQGFMGISEAPLDSGDHSCFLDLLSLSSSTRAAIVLLFYLLSYMRVFKVSCSCFAILVYFAGLTLSCLSNVHIIDCEHFLSFFINMCSSLITQVEGSCTWVRDVFLKIFKHSPQFACILSWKTMCVGSLAKGSLHCVLTGPNALSKIGQAHSASPTDAYQQRSLSRWPVAQAITSAALHLVVTYPVRSLPTLTQAPLPALLSLKPGYHLALHLRWLISCLSLTPTRTLPALACELCELCEHQAGFLSVLFMAVPEPGIVSAMEKPLHEYLLNECLKSK